MIDQSLLRPILEQALERDYLYEAADLARRRLECLVTHMSRLDYFIIQAVAPGLFGEDEDLQRVFDEAQEFGPCLYLEDGS